MAYALNELIKIDNESRAPLYMQVQQEIRAALQQQRLPINEPLPTERDMAEALGISRITIRKALDGLATEGLIERRRGAGTFVCERFDKNVAAMSSFTEDMRSQGRKPESRWLSRRTQDVTASESFQSGLAPGTPTYRFDRLRFADGIPMAVEYSIIPADCLPSVAAVEGSLYDALRAHGCKPVRALQRLRAIVLAETEAELLELSPGQPGLLIERRSFHGDGRPIEVTHSYYRGDAYDFISELNIDLPSWDKGL